MPTTSRPSARPLVRIALAAAAVLLVSLGTPACADDDAGVTAGEPPTTGVDAGTSVTVTVDEHCREIWYEEGSATYRARDLPDAWEPGQTVTGTMREVGDGELEFVADDGSGSVTFGGGEGAGFTDDCPGHPGDDPFADEPAVDGTNAVETGS